MLVFHWLNRVMEQCRACWSRCPLKERPLKLMRLEQRRVLNADFTFVTQAHLSLSHVDGDLSVRENSNYIEFDLTGSAWNHVGGNGAFTIDNSVANHSILTINRDDLGALTSGVSISADPNGAHRLTLETQNSALDFQVAAGPLAIRDFEDVSQVGSHDLAVNDFSVSARGHIGLQRLSGDDLTLSAAEIDFTGGEQSISGTTLTVQSGPVAAIELGGSLDRANVLDFTSTDLGALAGGFESIRFTAHNDQATGDIAVHSAGADVSEALSSTESGREGEVGSLHLTADSVFIDGELTSSGGLIEITATQAVTISRSGGLINYGGDVHVDAGFSGTLLGSGLIDVSSTDAGGTVHLLGQEVGLFHGARVNASGDSGGGEVLIGGDLHGDNEEIIHHASRTYVGSDVEINADAIQHGHGGKVVVWSDEVSQVYGSLTARGGALSGNGGLIETSSHGQLLLSGGGDASAVNGHAGTWLIDPLNVGIVHQLTLFPTIIEFNELPDFAPSVSGSEVIDDAIEAQLRTGTNVVITTENLNFSEEGNVTQAADATIEVVFEATGDSATLTINAANNITLNGGVTATNGALNVVLNSNAITNNDDLDLASGNVEINATIDLSGGSFESTGVDFESTGGAINASGGVTITQTGSVDLGEINTGTSTGGTLLIHGATAQQTIVVGEGNIAINGANSDTVIRADVTATNSVILSANQDVIVQATITVAGPTSDLVITADSDSDGVGGFWLDEGSSAADAQLNASDNITIIGSSLVATVVENDDVRIDGDGGNQQVIAGHDLTLLSNFDAASMVGDIVIDGVQEASSGSLTVFANNQICLGADQTAGTEIIFKSAVQLTNDVTVTAGDDVTFDSTVDDDGSDVTGSALTVTTASPGAAVLFVGKVGANTGDRLDSLTVNGAGFVDFLDTVTIDGDINVSTTLSVDIVTFQNAVVTTTGLGGLVTGSVTITNAGLLVTSSLATFDLAGSFTQNGTGSTELGADITTADGNVSFAQAVLLTDSVKINTSNSDRDITFSSTIDSEVVPLAFQDGELVPVSQIGGDVVDVKPEHNLLELTAGLGTIRFDGDIGAGFIDVGVGDDGDQMLGVGADGDQMPGSLIVNSANRIEIGPVMTIAVDGPIDFGRVSEIAGGIHIAGLGDPFATTIQSQFGEIHGDIHRDDPTDTRTIRLNGSVTSDVDLIIKAADGVLLTNAADITTNDHNITINGDTNHDANGNLEMGAETLIDAGAGFIDVSANNVLLGALLSTNANPTDSDNPAIRVEATTGSISDGGDVFTDITANTPGSGIVLSAVTGIGSGNALETDIAGLSAFNHDIVEEQQTVTLENVIGGTFTISWQPPESAPEETTQPIRFNATALEVRNALLEFDSLTAADIDVTSVGGGAFVLTFRGEYSGIDVEEVTTSGTDLSGDEASVVSATTRVLQPATGNIEIHDVGMTAGRVDLIFVHNQSNPGETGDVNNGVIDISVDAGDLRVVTDNSRPLLLEMRAGIDEGDLAIAAVQSENTIRLTANTIEIFDDLLAIQDSAPDDRQIGGTIEINARVNFVLGADRVISTDEHYVSSISEDLNRNGALDADEDVNDNGELDFNRDSKPATFADDANLDVIKILADADFEIGGVRDGSVWLGENSSISTDSGIEQQISPRPEKTPTDFLPYLYKSDTAFFSGPVIVSNLDTNGLLGLNPLYLGTLSFQIGVAGEKNLVLDIDWGDLTPANQNNVNFPTALANGSFKFDPVADRTATRFLIPEGGHVYVIPHEYTQNALNLKNAAGSDVAQPGRGLTTDPLQVRFAVSQHQSIRIEGQSVLNPDGSGTPAVPQNSPYDSPTVLNGQPPRAVSTVLNHSERFLLSSTDVSDDPTAFLPRFDNGQAAFTIPTSKAVSFFIPAEPNVTPLETPKLVFAETVVVTPSQLTTETTVVSASSSTVTTTEYFELRRFNDDGTLEIERLNDFQGDGLLDKERFEKFISDKGDGEYEIWFITRENTSGTIIERPVIHFRLEGGLLAPPPNDSPTLFKPFRLIPIPVIPKPANDAGDASGKPDAATDIDQERPIDMSPDERPSGEQSSNSDDMSANYADAQDSIFAALDTEAQVDESHHDSTTNAALVTGVLALVGTRRWNRHSAESGSSPFSRTARLARKLVARSSDQ